MDGSIQMNNNLEFLIADCVTNNYLFVNKYNEVTNLASDFQGKYGYDWKEKTHWIPHDLTWIFDNEALICHTLKDAYYIKIDS